MGSAQQLPAQPPALTQQPPAQQLPAQPSAPIQQPPALQAEALASVPPVNALDLFRERGAVDRLAPMDVIWPDEVVSDGDEVPMRHQDLAPGQGPAGQIETVVRMAGNAVRDITLGMSNLELLCTLGRVGSQQPPAQQLRAQQPPAQQLPAQQPPAQQPPAQQLPAQQPPAQQPPAQQIPAQQIPARSAPASWNGYTQAEWNEWHALGNSIGTGVRKS